MSKRMNQNFKSIILSNTQGIYNKEATVDVTGAAGSMLTPGMLVELLGTNPTSLDRDEVRAHSTDGGYNEVAVLLEDELQGKGIYAAAASSSYGAPPNSTLEEFVDGSIAQYRVFQKGDQFLAVMHQASDSTLASDTTITKGKLMASKGNGSMKLADVAGGDIPLVRALETVTLPVPLSGDDLCYIPVEVI